MEVKPGSPEALTTEISQGRWLVIADTLQQPRQLQQASSVHWLGFLVSVGENKRNIVLWTAIGTILVFTFSLFIPDRYTASTQLLPPPLNQSGISSLLGQFGDLTNLAGRDPFKTSNTLYLALLRSNTVTERVIARLGLMKIYGTQRLSDCRARLEKRTQVEGLKEGVIVVQVEDRDPQRAAAIANAYVEELISLNKRLAVGEAGRRRIFFEQQVKDAQEELTAAEENLKQSQEHTGMVQLDSQARSIMDAEALLRAHIALKEAQIEKLRLSLTEQNPALQGLEIELSAIQKELQQAETRGNKGGGLDFSSAKLPASGLEYIRRVRDVKYHELVFEMLSKQMELARIDEAKEGSLIQVIDPAKVPDRKSGPSRSLIALLGFIFSFTISLCRVALKNALARARLNPDTDRQLTLLANTLKLSLRKNGNLQY